MSPNGEFKIVPSVYYGDHDFIVAHHHFNTTGGQAPRPLACSVLTSQLNCLLLYKLATCNLTTLNLLPTAPECMCMCACVCVCSTCAYMCVCVRVYIHVCVCVCVCVSHKFLPQ